MVNESFKQALRGELLAVALCSLSRVCHKCRNEQYTVITDLCPPVLPSATPAPLAVGKSPLRAAGVEGTCRSCQCLSLDTCSILFCLQPFTRAQSPLLPSWAGLGHLPLLWARWKIHSVRGQISVVLGWEAWWVSQDLLRRMGNDFLIKFLICMLIAVLLRITLF